MICVHFHKMLRQHCLPFSRNSIILSLNRYWFSKRSYAITILNKSVRVMFVRILLNTSWHNLTVFMCILVSTIAIVIRLSIHTKHIIYNSQPEDDAMKRTTKEKQITKRKKNLSQKRKSQDEGTELLKLIRFWTDEDIRQKTFFFLLKAGKNNKFVMGRLSSSFFYIHLVLN